MKETKKKIIKTSLIRVIFSLIVVTFLGGSATAAMISDRVSGRIVLDVHSRGEAWYIYPENKKRYYLGRANDAYQIMRFLSLGITNADLARIPTNTESNTGDWALRNRLSGMILLQVEEHGEAWYVYPHDLKRYYLGTAEDAYRIMSNLGLGISTTDLSHIAIAEDGFVYPETVNQPREGLLENTENSPREETVETRTNQSVENEEVIASEKNTYNVSENCDEVYALSDFYRDTTKSALQYETKLTNEGNYTDAKTLREISCTAQAIWINGGNAVEQAAKINKHTVNAAKENKIPVFVLYNIPEHGTLEWRSGIANGKEYTDWMTAIAKAFGNHTAWIIIEPDALLFAFEYSASDSAYRLNQLKETVDIFKTHAPNTKKYLDGGHSSWKSSDKVADFLLKAGVANADGFFLNASNFRLLEDEIEYGNELSSLIGNKHFVIDTSRNGNGPTADNAWCNPHGRALGKNPTVKTGYTRIDAYLWIKSPGESDGYCNGGPGPGQFWLEYALDLVRNRS